MLQSRFFICEYISLLTKIVHELQFDLLSLLEPRGHLWDRHLRVLSILLYSVDLRVLETDWRKNSFALTFFFLSLKEGNIVVALGRRFGIIVLNSIFLACRVCLYQCIPFLMWHDILEVGRRLSGHLRVLVAEHRSGCYFSEIIEFRLLDSRKLLLNHAQATVGHSLRLWSILICQCILFE